MDETLPTFFYFFSPAETLWRREKLFFLFFFAPLRPVHGIIPSISNLS